jgi:ribonuclease D
LKAKLDAMLQREGRLAEADACFSFLGVRAGLDLAGFEDLDIFAH